MAHSLLNLTGAYKLRNLTWPKLFVPVTEYMAILCGVFLVSWGYQGSFLLLNGLHTTWGDAIFPYLTQLGDSLILCSLVVLIYWRRAPGMVVFFIIAVALTGIASQLLKHQLFSDWHRPLGTFAEGQVHFFAWEAPHYNSMPSGHTTTAFAGATALAIHHGKQFYSQLAITLLAWGVAYSRVYIGVHFLGDVLAGALLGTILTLLMAYYWLPRLQWHLSREWLAKRPALFWGMLLLGAVGLAFGLYNRFGHLLGL